MANKSFDRKFGKDLFASLPASPGVYLFLDEAGTIIYVGKAKNLRRRLGQYRNARRCKKHHKMRSIVRDATAMRFESLASDLEACLRETALIQELRPKWNVAGAFSFLYPLIGMRWNGSDASFCWTTQPERSPGYQFHGSFRSRFIVREAFYSLMELLEYVGHRNRKARRVALQRGYPRDFEFRQLPAEWALSWERFWKGESKEALEQLSMALLENAGARRSAAEVEEHLRNLLRFWRHEAQPLHKARVRSGIPEWPVPQKQRDPLFLRARLGQPTREEAPHP